MLVGMSKSGSRYGRRSNWFKIHCLLAEQQAAAAAQGPKNTPPPSTLTMLGHPSYPHGLYARPPCTKEELMLLAYEDYKHPAASPSVSSPDSHNSDSSVEVGDRRNSTQLRQSMPPRDSMPQFLPLPFPGLPMPPHAFLPPHLMYAGYHPALYSQHQGLLKPVMEASMMQNGQSPSSLAANNNSRFVPNHNNKNDEEAKRYFLDAVLKSQQRSPIDVQTKSEDEDTEEDLVVSMTPPRSPPTTPKLQQIPAIRPISLSTSRATSIPTATIAVATPPPPPLPPQRSAVAAHLQDNPIDLSMRTGSSCTSDDMRTMSPGADSIGADSCCEEDLDTLKKIRSTSSMSEHDNDTDDYEHEVKRSRISGTTTPLDLTTKV